MRSTASPKGSYKGLAGSKVEVPERFNWVEEIFEGIHTRRDPDRIALLWTAQDGNEKRFTFGEFAARGNKLLNLFREKGLRKAIRYSSCYRRSQRSGSATSLRSREALS